MKLSKTWFLALFAAFVLLPAAAQADPLTITLTNSNQTGAIGTTLSFSGILANGDTPGVNDGILLDSASVTFLGGSFASNTDPFFINAPVTLAQGESTGNIELFLVTINPGTPLGVPFTGTFRVNYTSAITNSSLFATANFTVTAQQQVEPIPEPTTMALLGTGLVGATVARRRKKRQVAEE